MPFESKKRLLLQRALIHRLFFFFFCNQKEVFSGSLDMPVRGKPIHVAVAATRGTALCAALCHGDEGRERGTKAFLPLHKQSMTN